MLGHPLRQFIWLNLAIGMTGCPQPVAETAPPLPEPTTQPQPWPQPQPPPPPTTAVVRPGTVDLNRTPPTLDTTQWADGAQCPGCDVVLVSVCSLRGDHIGAYGGTASATPAMDQLAKTGTRFNRAYAGANFTLGSLATMLTGKFGSSTGVLNWGRGLPENHRTVPEVLGLFGYRTGAFSVDAATGFRPDYGLDRGFQRMRIIDPPRDTPDGRHRNEDMGLGGATAKPLAEWLTSQPMDAPVFAMLHTRSAHFPFVVDKTGVETDRTGVRQALWDEGSGQRNRPADRAMPGKAGGQHRTGLVQVGALTIQRTVRDAGAQGVAVWRETYAESVSRTDRDIQVVLDAIAQRGKPTIVIVLADHGETLDDNNELLHGAGFYESVVRVPLLIQVPGLPTPKTIDALVSQADLLPTIAELVGVVPPEEIDGVSLVPLLNGSVQSVRSTVLVEGGPAWQGHGTLPGAVISPPWTLLEQSFLCTPTDSQPPPPAPGQPLDDNLLHTCLFNLERDPGQLTNLATQHPEIVEQLRTRWSGFRSARAGKNLPRDLRLDASMIEMLQRTGYDFRSEGE
jgi:arylsulfatase A-like enzyme